MSNNLLLTPSTYCKGVLMNLGGYLSVGRNMSREYSKYFAKEGAKVGDTISKRKPQRFEVTEGLGYQGQPIANTRVTITADQVVGVHFEWDGVEKTLSIDDAQDNYFKPAAIAIAHRINAKAAQFCAQRTFNAVGTPGTTPSTIDTYLSAGDKIVQLGLPPEEELACIINRKMSSTFVIGQKTYFNPAGSIGNMVKRGELGSGDETLGYTWYRDQTIYSQTVGPLGGTPLVNGASQTADGGNNATQSLITDGWTASAAARLNAGDRFTIANVYSVHPQTRQSTGDLQQFVVLAAASSDGSGNLTATISPAITPTGQYQNVDSAPADNAALTIFGAANTVSPQGLLMHKNAFALVSVPMETPTKGVIMSAAETDPDTELSLSLVQYFDGDSRTVKTRFDTLFGMASLYPEMACVIAA